MKILLDNIIYSNVQNGGVSNAWFELSKYLLNQTDNEIKFIQESNDYLNFHRKQLNIPENQIISNGKPFKLSTRILPFEYKTDEKFIYHSSYYRGLKGAKNKIEVTTIHDFTPNYYFPYLKKIIHNTLKFPALKRANGIICISKNTYSDLLKFCPPKKNQKVEVIYNGVSDDYFPLKEFIIKDKAFIKKHKIDSEFYLFVGARTNYKNFSFIVSLLNKYDEFKLVIVGGGALSINELKLFDKQSLHRLTHIISATNQELNLLYNKALALVYPSSYEGFGIPVIEAMKAGCPVIALNASSVPEIAGNAAILLDKLDYSLTNNILINLSTNDYRDEIIEKGILQSQKFSWEKCCTETHEFYKELY